MEPRSLEFIASACNGEIRWGSSETLVTRVCTDSRQIMPGDLFVALAGEKFDAHDYLVEVAHSGATALLVSRDKIDRTSGISDAVAMVVVERASTKGCNQVKRDQRR